MKKKLLLTLLMVAMFVMVFTVAVGAISSNYRTERTYNYYEDEIADGNLLFTAKTLFAYDNSNKDKYRYEVITSSSGVGFAKVDANGTPLTWYVVSDDKDADGDFVTNIIVTSTPTLGGVVGNVDANGSYTYGTADDGVSYSKKVVSVNFFGTGVKKLPDQAYMAVASSTPNGSTAEYCQMADGAYLLGLYLPRTLEAMPIQLCYRSPLINLEFEDNVALYSSFPSVSISSSDKGYAFSFCANLKKLVLPEGITKIETRQFRENLSLEYVKLPNSLTSIPSDAFFRAGSMRTLILGENVTFIGNINTAPGRFSLQSKAENLKIKYVYVPKTINTKNSTFDSYKGAQTEYLGDATNVSIVFFFSGSLEEARVVANYTDRHFRDAVNGLASYPKNAGVKGQDPISWEEYCSKKEYYDNLPSDRHVLVYDVPSCVAFYDGNHVLTNGVQYTDAISPITVGDICSRCGYTDVETYEPILTLLGFSAQIGGDRLCLGYLVNEKSAALVPDLSYGVVVTIPTADALAGIETYEPLNVDLSLAVEKGVVMPVEKGYGAFELIVKSFSKNSEYYGTQIVISAFVADGEKVDYLCYDEDGNAFQSEYAIPTTFRTVAENCTEKYRVTYSLDDEAMGTIEGEASQKVFVGEKATTVTAVPKSGYSFVCWSDGKNYITTPSIEVIPEKDMEYVAYFTPASTGLPVMKIDTTSGYDILTKDYYIACEISLLDTETGNNIGGAIAEIKGRGNSTWTKFDKKPYKFKFDKKQNLFGYGNEKTWVLLADARDYSLARNMLALNAALEMSELTYTSKGQHVELYVNGVYKGVYYLCEQIQVKENRVNITEEDKELVQGPADLGYLIEMDAWISEDCGGKDKVPNSGITSDGDIFVRVDDGMYNGYTIKDPEDVFLDADGNFDATKAAPYLDYIQAYIKNSLAAASGDDYAAVCELIDVKSFAQAYIIYDLFKNPDTQYSSVYFYKDAGGKLVCSPVWDFDMAIGNVTHKANAGSNAQNFRDTTFLWTAQKNTWFRELLEFEDFRSLVGEELQKNEVAIRASIASDLAYIRENIEAYKKNFEVWNLINNLKASEAMGAWSVPTEFKDFDTYEEHLIYIETYLDASLNYLMEVYPAPASN